MSNRMVNTLFEMVRIDSESGNEERFISYVKKLFETEFRAKCTLDSYGNLIVSLSGKGETPIMFGCHGDTVPPGVGIEPFVDNGIIRSKGNTILGADNKAGITELIEAIRTADRRPPLEIVISREEEIGLKGAKNLDFSLLSAKMGFVVDGDVLDCVVIGGPSHMLIDVDITGKAAHAGMEPEKGISAIKAASYGISMLKDGRIDHETTVNVGIIQGGEIRNGVPSKAQIKMECRSLTHEKCIAQGELITDLFNVAARAVGAEIEIKSDLAYKASSIPEDAEVVKIATRAAGSVGIKPKVISICGGTDASVFNEKGIQTVVIGTGVQAEHSVDEHIAISDMEKAVGMIRYILHETSK
ncbi:MAG: M20/M25/M40 family metallo-hydrolase [Firmicutes bacterium]|nr:M20/M25/M40 family metallo-hydrolase [Bacillota bacterium]